MKKEFRFLDKNYSLEMDDSNSSDGDFDGIFSATWNSPKP